MKAKDWLLLGAVAGAGLWVYGKLGGVSKALTTAGEAIGSGLYDLFNPDPLGEVTYYIVRFPDGAKHAVPSRSVSADGFFTNTGDGYKYKGDGKRYKLLTDRTTGARAAFLA